MKVRITVTNDENQTDFDHEYENVEFFEIGGFQGMDFWDRGKWEVKKNGSFNGTNILLVLKGKLPANIVPKETIQVPLEQP